MYVVLYRKYFYIFSGAMIVIALACTLLFGLRFGIDFTGGALLEIEYPNGRPSATDVSANISKIPIGTFSLRESGDAGYILRTRDLTEDERVAVVTALSGGGEAVVEQKRYTSIGPTIGAELRSKGVVAVAVVILSILLYVAWAFRGVSKPVSSWKYAALTLISLLHDVIVPIGLFSVLGYFAGVEVDALFLTALLVTLGYSINDTVIIFDRIRENLRKNEEADRKEPFEELVGRSLSQTYARSINTSVTTMIALVAIYFFGGESTKLFALALIAGVASGAYSSIALAAPLLVTIETWQRRSKRT